MDLVEVLNQAFPDAETLQARLPQAQDHTKLCEQYLEAQLNSRVPTSEARSVAVGAPQRLAQLKRDAHDVKSLGQTSLSKVNEVTAGIKRLDRTKENLSQTVRMLRQLRMLSKLYTQLDALLKARQYGELANSVTATADLVEFFRPFRTVPRIAQLSQRISELQSRMYDQIQGEFETALSQPLSEAPKNSANLRDASYVIDSLDVNLPQTTNRDRFLQWYAQTVLREYFTIFAVADEAGTLENIKRRYAYLKNKVLNVYADVHSHWFPQEWKVRDRLLKTALERTAQDLDLHCERLSVSNDLDMQLLVTSLQETLDFERSARCEPIVSQSIASYLPMWVNFQDRQLSMRIQTLRNGSGASATDEGGVLSTSKELVNLLRLLMSQLQKLTQDTQVTNAFYKVLAKALGRYGHVVLLAQLPGGQFARSSIELANAGAVAMTAQYLLATVNQLEEQAPDQVVTDDFNELARRPLFPVIDRAEELAVGYVEHRLEQHWREMEAVQMWHAAGKVSDYAARLCNSLDQATTEALAVMPTPVMTYDLCNRIVEMVNLTFLSTGITRTPRPVTEDAAEQMLFDLYAVKSRLMKLVELAPAEVLESQKQRASLRLKRFPDRTQETVGHAEAVFKVLMTPTEPVGDFVENYVLLLKDSSVANFRKLLEVKGARYPAKAVEVFRTRLSQTQPGDLVDSQILSQISLTQPRSTGGDLSPGPTLVQSFRKLINIQRRD